MLAFPSCGGALTEAVNSDSDIFPIFSVFALGFTLTEIFILSTIAKCFLNRYHLFHLSNRKESVIMPATESEFKGNPMLVLSQGPDDKFPFQFGLKKAKLILENLEEIKKFVEKNSGPK